MPTREFDVVIEPQDDGGYVASVPDLPGCWTQGDTREEAIEMIRDAIAGYMDTLSELGRPIPKVEREHIKIAA